MMRKKFWLIPVMILAVVYGALAVFTKDSVLAPFIYTISDGAARQLTSRRANSAGIRRSEIACPIGVCVLERKAAAGSWHGLSAKGGRTRTA